MRVEGEYHVGTRKQLMSGAAMHDIQHSAIRLLLIHAVLSNHSVACMLLSWNGLAVG